MMRHSTVFRPAAGDPARHNSRAGREFALDSGKARCETKGLTQGGVAMRPAVPSPGPDPEFFPIAEATEAIPPLPVVHLPPRPPSPPPLPTVDAHGVIGGVVREHGPRIHAKRLKVSLR